MRLDIAIDFLLVFFLMVSFAGKATSYIAQSQGLGCEANPFNASLIPVFGLLGMHIFSFLITAVEAVMLKIVDRISNKVLCKYPNNQRIVQWVVLCLFVFVIASMLVDFFNNLNVILN